MDQIYTLEASLFYKLGLNDIAIVYKRIKNLIIYIFCLVLLGFAERWLLGRVCVRSWMWARLLYSQLWEYYQWNQNIIQFQTKTLLFFIQPTTQTNEQYQPVSVLWESIILRIFLKGMKGMRKWSIFCICLLPLECWFTCRSFFSYSKISCWFTKVLQLLICFFPWVDKVFKFSTPENMLKK